MKAQLKRMEAVFLLRSLCWTTAVFLMGAGLSGCKKITLNSVWRDRGVSIDGLNTEWQNAMTYIEGQDAAVGLLNDEEFLYVCLVVNDSGLERQMRGRGLIVWLDSEGGKKKTFGIRYPMGMQGAGMPPMRMEDEQNRERMMEMFESSMSELEVLESGEDEGERMSMTEASGIDVHLSTITGSFVYELKVPLLRSEEYPYAVGAEKGALIGLGFEIPEIDLDAMGDRMGGEMGGGMRGGGGRGGGGMRGGGGRGPGGGPGAGARMGMLSSFKVWAKVQLASDTRSIEE